MSQSVASLVAGLLYVLAALTSIFVFIVCLRKHTRTRTFKTKSWMLAFLNLALSLFLMSVFLIFDYPKILVLSFAFLFSWGAIGIWVLFLGRLIPYAGQRIVTYIISMLPLLFIPVFIFSEPVGIFDVAHSMYMVMLLLAAGTVSLLFLAWFFGYIKSRLDDFFSVCGNLGVSDCRGCLAHICNSGCFSLPDIRIAFHCWTILISLYVGELWTKNRLTR